jgi:transketolase
MVLYEKYLKFDPQNPAWKDRDYFILSKGHAAPLIYSMLAVKGYFPEEELKTLRKFGSRLQGHPDALKLPGIEVSTGSLGQGFGVAAGVALGVKVSGQKNRVYALLGDGEIQEGSVWETAMAASHYQLKNFCAIVDANKFQIDGKVENVMNVEPIKEKFQAFGWRALEINGHDLEEIDNAFNWFVESNEEKPSVIIAQTIKGKGVSFMENTEKWHGKAPQDEEYKSAQTELRGE